MVCVVPRPRSNCVASLGCWRGVVLIFIGANVIIVEICHSLPYDRRIGIFVSDPATTSNEMVDRGAYLVVLTSVRARGEAIDQAIVEIILSPEQQDLAV